MKTTEETPIIYRHESGFLCHIKKSFDWVTVVYPLDENNNRIIENIFGLHGGEDHYKTFVVRTRKLTSLSEY